MQQATYRGFTLEEIVLLSEARGQGEAMSKTGAKGIWAAKEWIDTYWQTDPERAVRERGSISKIQKEFPLYSLDKLYPDLVDRSVASKAID